MTDVDKVIRKVFRKRNWFERAMMSLSRGLRNLVIWFPVIFSDRQWDFCFFYLILRQKLKLMEDFFNSDYAMTASAKDDAKTIHQAVVLCDKLIEDDYYDPDEENYNCNYYYIHRQADKKQLFDLLKENIDNWWD